MGQTKPVLIIRLFTEHTIEEIVLRRAQNKRRLRQAVLDKGRLNHICESDDNQCPDFETSLESIRYGLNSVCSSDDSSIVQLTDDDIDHILNSTKDTSATVESSGSLQIQESLSDDTEPQSDNIYFWEGTDYRQEDRIAFERLLASSQEVPIEQENADSETTLEPISARLRKRGVSVLYSEEHISPEANKQKKAQLKKEKLHQLWSRNNYRSLAIYPEFDDKSFATNLAINIPETELELRYITGNLIQAHPEPSLIAVVVDNSGRWPDRGLFRMMNTLFPTSRSYYMEAFQNKDLSLASVHVIFSPHRDDPYLALMIGELVEIHTAGFFLKNGET